VQTFRYAIKPTGLGVSGALACVSSTISPWAEFGTGTGTQLRHANAMWPMGSADGSTV